ncbi:TetR/AcrR family transcriptional regulator [Lactobacillaceae bacterium 24-114]
MPSSTFLNLNDEKKQVITNALLEEFSKHSLPDAQVARIVKSAGIARGAFYKYFADLEDAYQYLYQKSITEIHQGITNNHQVLSAKGYKKQITDFITKVMGGEYSKLFRLHYQVNEHLIQSNSTSLQPHSSMEWAVMVLSHETIKDTLENPKKAEELIERYYHALKIMMKGE